MSSPACYEIILRGRLDDSWSSSLEGMKVSVSINADKTAVTRLKGELQDQAALFGVLNMVYDLGMPLVHVQMLDVCENDSRKRVFS